jgi:hypothetical protein
MTGRGWADESVRRYVSSGGSAVLIAALTFFIKSSRLPNSVGSIGE